MSEAGRAARPASSFPSLNRRAAAAAVALALVSLGPAAVAQPGAGPALADGVETIPLDLSGPRPIARLTIGGHAPVPVIFDTGASGNVLDSAFAESLGLANLGEALVGSPAGGTPVRGFRTRIPEGRLGDARLRAVDAVAFPLGLPAARGIFGPGTFSGRLVTIDLGRGEVRIGPRSAASLPGGPSVPYSAGPRGLPGASVEIGGRAFEGHIDTGSNRALTFPLALAAELPLESAPVPVGRARIGGGQEIDVLGARIRGTVRIGPVTLENPEVGFIAGLPRINVGMPALRNLRIVLDPAERRGWLVR